MRHVAVNKPLLWAHRTCQLTQTVKVSKPFAQHIIRGGKRKMMQDAQGFEILQAQSSNQKDHIGDPVVSTSNSSSSTSLSTLPNLPITHVEESLGQKSALLPGVFTSVTTVHNPFIQSPSTSRASTKNRSADKRVGRWSLDEKILFLYGLRKFGKGRWKKMSMYLPDRSLVQIKSHGQKVLKRMTEGEDVFRRLEESLPRLTGLLERLNHTFEPEVMSNRLIEQQMGGFLQPLGQQTGSAADGREHIIAASALCQLATPGEEGTSAQTTPQAVSYANITSLPAVFPNVLDGTLAPVMLSLNPQAIADIQRQQRHEQESSVGELKGLAVPL